MKIIMLLMLLSIAPWINAQSMHHHGQQTMADVPAPREVKPASAAENHATDMAGMHYYQLMIEQFEYQYAHRADRAVNSEGYFYWGGDIDKLQIAWQADNAGNQQELELDLLWTHAVSAFWDMQLGVRHQQYEAHKRAWLVASIQGLAPYWFETQATLALAKSGQAKLEFESAYDTRLTQQWIAQSQVEIAAFSQDEKAWSEAKGIAYVDLSLRLRYESHRQFAPYLGIAWRQYLAENAELRQTAGEKAQFWQVMLGFRAWF